MLVKQAWTNFDMTIHAEVGLRRHLALVWPLQANPIFCASLTMKDLFCYGKNPNKNRIPVVNCKNILAKPNKGDINIKVSYQDFVEQVLNFVWPLSNCVFKLLLTCQKEKENLDRFTTPKMKQDTCIVGP